MLLRAFAKINLHLRILHKRSDGYHEVYTVLQTVDLADEILLEPAEKFSFTATESPTDESNLVVRAVRKFESLTGRPAAVRIALKKNIPMGAGLGGGSADAAVTVLGLQKMFGRPLSESDQLQCLQQLGSDVPFFAFGGKAIGRGRGDDISPVEDQHEDSDYVIVIVAPGILINTAEAYSWLTVAHRSNSIKGFGAEFVSSNAGQDQGNDFEDAVFARHPALADVKQELYEVGAFRASLTGSGSAVYGLFRAREAAARAASGFAGRFTTHVSRPLPRSEYLSRILVD